MMQLPQKELEHFLTAIYKAIIEKGTKFQRPKPLGIVAQRLAYLDYFETLCVEPKSANIIINSSLLTLFVQIIQSGKSPALRAKLAHVIGVLIRHATLISSSVRYCSGI